MITNLELVRKLKKVGGVTLLFPTTAAKKCFKGLFPKVERDSPGFVDIRFPSKEVTGTKYMWIIESSLSNTATS